MRKYVIQNTDKCHVIIIHHHQSISIKKKQGDITHTWKESLCVAGEIAVIVS